MNLATITNKKKELKNSLSKTRNGFVTIIFKGLANEKSLKDIFKEIKTKYPNANNKMIQKASILVKKAKSLIEKPKKEQIEEQFEVFPVVLLGLSLGKRTKGKRKVLKLADVVFEALNEIDFDGEMRKIENEIANIEERRLKEEAIDDDMKKSRNKGKIFYLVSSHDDCADDHKEWQGKIYYDRAWRNVVTDQDEQKMILAYINQFKLRTIQWVTHRPVWLITRPNCRHFYKSIETEEAMKRESYTDLLLKHNIHFNEGQKKTQTIAHSLNKDWYNRQNIENIIKQYVERREYHLAMRRSGEQSFLLDEAIKKDNLLIKKWRALLSKTK